MAKRALEKTKAKPVSYSVGSASGASSTANNNKKRRGDGPSTALEKAWANDQRSQLDAKIARAFYSGGLPFNFARNPHYQEAFTFAATHNIPGYKPPGYNKLRTTLLKQEKLHIDGLLDHVKSTWGERGVTICTDGDKKTSRYIFDKIKSVIEEIGPHNVVQVITDNASNCRGEVKSALQTMVISPEWDAYKEEIQVAAAVKEKILSDVWWAKGNNPLHCMAHSLNPKYYSAKWLAQDKNREPPHKDDKVSKMRLKCFRKFFPIEEQLAKVKEEYTRFSTSSEEFNDHESINDRWMSSPMAWWTNHGSSIPLLQSLAIKLVSQPASSSCCERNWSTYSFIHSVSRNALTPERAQDLVFNHTNLRLLSRRFDAYKRGESLMWDVGGDAFESLTGVGLLEVANLSIDEPELEGISFGEVDAGAVNMEDEEED
ncbi:hypothetical protein ACQ4PT_035393 [Festuca glaucescens]